MAEFLKLTPEPLKALPSPKNTYTITYTKHPKHNKGTDACGNPWNLVQHVGPSTVTTHTADADPTVATSETLVTVQGLGRDDALDQRQILNESNKENEETENENECNQVSNQEKPKRKTHDNDEKQVTTTSNQAIKRFLRPRNNHA